MKKLVITYNGNTLFDGDVASFQWSDDDRKGIVAQAKLAGIPDEPTAGASILDALKQASAKATETKRTELNGV